jgi:hypothetical protein
LSRAPVSAPAVPVASTDSKKAGPTSPYGNQRWLGPRVTCEPPRPALSKPVILCRVIGPSGHPSAHRTGICPASTGPCLLPRALQERFSPRFCPGHIGKGVLLHEEATQELPAYGITGFQDGRQSGPINAETSLGGLATRLQLLRRLSVANCMAKAPRTAPDGSAQAASRRRPASSCAASRASAWTGRPAVVDGANSALAGLRGVDRLQKSLAYKPNGTSGGPGLGSLASPLARQLSKAGNPVI